MLPREGRDAPGDFRPGNSLQNTCEELVQAALRRARDEASELGLSLPQLFMVNALHRTGPIPSSRLVAWTGATASTITGVLDNLVEEGLLQREHGEEDRRQVIVQLTPKGHRVAHRLERARSRFWRPLSSRIRAAEKRVTLQVLREVISEFRSRSAQDSRPPARSRRSPRAGTPGGA